MVTVKQMAVKLAQKKVKAGKLTDELKCLKAEIKEISDQLKALKAKEKTSPKAIVNPKKNLATRKK